jgi:hypothetical protein
MLLNYLPGADRRIVMDDSPLAPDCTTAAVGDQKVVIRSLFWERASPCPANDLVIYGEALL